MRDIGALLAFVSDRMRAPLAWGRHDCVTFAAGAVEAMTGRNLLPKGVTWSTARGARRVLKRLGGMKAIVDARLEAIPPAMAARGDIGAVAGVGGELALVVVELDEVIGVGERGLERLARAALLHAWSSTAFR